MTQEERLKNLEKSLKKHLQAIHDEVKEAGLDFNYISSYIFDHYGEHENYCGAVFNHQESEKPFFFHYSNLDEDEESEG